MLITERFYTRGYLQVFPYLLPQHSIPFSVQDAHLTHIDHNRIIDKSGDNLNRFIKTFASDVYIGIEVESPLRYRRAGMF